ncbi:hypothetical protein [Halobacterium litoreum]|uniref:CHAT domain-containing protein n=1 Tax=Halobacterium litoreum TaxID=2039234 RepID=A0ABD5NE59_9EURY|nr:hypothetical protein [Halobacterium litoreum]UHH13517.1 hypothetical protein LT972_00640 [Halobacterium litoreum]
MTVEFEPLDGDDGLRVRDTTEGEQFELRADRALDPEPASPDEFAMPVDSAVAVEAGEIHFPGLLPAIFMEGGDVVHQTEDAESSERLSRGTYEVDVSPPAAKVFVKVCDGTVAARYADDHVYIDADPSTRLVVGVRSHHESPEATVTVTDDPRDLMAAVSTFGSALKSHTPDRSWPTLRGHPPTVRRGDELDVPDAVAPPDTGVTVEVPPEYGAVYTVAPLAYYLGATVEPGPKPRLRAAGAVREFDPDALAADVRTCLGHLFALDGVVRSVGVYPFRHEQAETFDDRTEVDYEHLFDLPLDERTAAYLDVPRYATDGLVDWHLTADVADEPQTAPTLPYLVDELALIRSPPPTPRPATRSPEPDALSRSAAQTATASQSTAPTEVVVPSPADTPGHAWVADGFAVDAASPTVGSFQRAADWPQGDGPLDVHVVYNDTRIDDPDETPYDSHPMSETDVTVSRSLTTTELRDVLHEDTDFLHFVGHVTDYGMVCPDGTLDLRTLASTGVGAFFLNGCRSYEQGHALLTAGSAAGIVTVDDVADATASAVGHYAAMLLDAGFPMYATLDSLRYSGVDTERYTLLGDPTLALRRAVSGSPQLYEFDTSQATGDDAVPVTVHEYPDNDANLGGFWTTNPTEAGNRLYSAAVDRQEILLESIENELKNPPLPTLVDGTLKLSDEIDLGDFS